MKLSEDERQTFRGWCAALMEAHTETEYKKIAELIKNFAAKQDFLPWWKWWAPRCPHLVPAIRGLNLPKVNMAEIGQSKLKQDKVLWLSQAVKYDMVEFRFQAVKYNKFVSNHKKVTGQGPTMKKRNEHEGAEERRFVDKFCEVILHGDLLDEVKDPNAKDFMPSLHAKHKAPKNMNIGIQEHPPKKSNTKRVRKKMPDRIGKGFNPRYNTGVEKERNNEQICQHVNNEMLVPENIEKEFMKANRVYYIVLKQEQEKSTKQIVKCQGCDRAITLDDKKFPNNMVFHFKTYHLVPTPGSQGMYVMSCEKQNCYFHAKDMTCLHQINKLVNIRISDVYMDNRNYRDLKLENRQRLEARGHLEAILEVREKLA